MTHRPSICQTFALAALVCVSAPGTPRALCQTDSAPTAAPVSQPRYVQPLEIAAIDRMGRPGPWQPYDPNRDLGDLTASSIQFDSGETRKLRSPNPIFVPTEGAGCEGFDPICFQLCSQTRYILTDCERTYGGIRISAISAATCSGQPGDVNQIFLAWTNKRDPGQMDDLNRPINDTVIEILVYDSQFDPNCGPGQGNLTGGVLVNFGPLPAQCGMDTYYAATLNLLDLPGICVTIPGPSLPFGYEVRFWYDVNRSAPAANNQAMLWGTKDPAAQGQTERNGYIDDDYDGVYDPNTECFDLNLQPCPRPLAAALSFWGNDVVGRQILWANGPSVTGFNNGCAGSDTSAVEAPGTLFGVETNLGLMHQADDFTVTVGHTWTLDNLTWYLFQPDSAPTDPITAAYIQIWDGVPGAGGAVIAGDLTTNRLTSWEFVDTYRVPVGNLTDCRRAVKAAYVDMTWAPALPQGTYWIQIATTGTGGFPGPLANPVVPRRVSTDNSRTFDVGSNTWSQNFDAGLAFDQPFELEGFSTPSSCQPDYQLRISGECPGRVLVQWDNAQPRATQALVFGLNLGKTRIPDNYPCSGMFLGIQGQVRLLNPPGYFSTGNGSGLLQGNAGEAACGHYLQLVQGGNCQRSNVAQLPGR